MPVTETSGRIVNFEVRTAGPSGHGTYNRKYFCPFGVNRMIFDLSCGFAGLRSTSSHRPARTVDIVSSSASFPCWIACQLTRNSTVDPSLNCFSTRSRALPLERSLELEQQTHTAATTNTSSFRICGPPIFDFIPVTSATLYPHLVVPFGGR